MFRGSINPRKEETEINDRRAAAELAKVEEPRRIESVGTLIVVLENSESINFDYESIAGKQGRDGHRKALVVSSGSGRRSNERK